MLTGRHRPIRVFAHLAFDKDARCWQAAQASGQLVGLNDETPYGYGRAARMGCSVTFSRSDARGVVAHACRLGLRAGLGFDLAHAHRQSHAILAADAVWTHTESQFLAAAAILARVGRGGPKLIGQAVWLYDRWPQLSRLQRALYRRLIARVDVLTTLSPANAAVARALFPDKRVEVIPFGIPSENARPPRPMTDAATGPVCRVVAVGNDRHRDWPTLVHALANADGIAVDVLSHTAPEKLAKAAGNVVIGPARTNAALKAAYERATLAVVPLHENLHASGITAIQEAILAGLPVVATDTGGLRHYFGDDAITYVPPRDPAALQRAVLGLTGNSDRARTMTARAQRRIVEGRLDAQGYVQRHVDLSQEIGA